MFLGSGDLGVVPLIHSRMVNIQAKTLKCREPGFGAIQVLVVGTENITLEGPAQIQSH